MEMQPLDFEKPYHAKGAFAPVLKGLYLQHSPPLFEGFIVSRQQLLCSALQHTAEAAAALTGQQQSSVS
ncbi:hypothetical protein F2P81_023454 [Scophthalmus maximus]|uniref:Uncharacterized protein n=1 Tax=Scophthalmus maximus TaxID=52904 RepID=A0A6A4RZQ7_SCOMX|nr:hypothetical protein F2P81_023454 [Scophthalmus maximus]